MFSFRIQDHEGIRKFLEGDDSYVPISELQYLHTRPLLRPNFVTEIDDLAIEVGNKIVEKKITGKPIERFEEIAIAIGTRMHNPQISDEDAKHILLSLRDLYKLCLGLKEKL